jgi:hypothetical protein
MPSKAILQEAQNLKDVCKRLEALAERHTHITESLMAICGTIQSSATILEVLVTTKLEASRPM